MLVSEKPVASTVAPLGSAHTVRARIRTPSGEQLVDLPWGKNTIGSSPRCNIRIQEPGVHPLHCLIVRTSDGLAVRRWSADTRLNGAPFDEARLSAGDHLSIGTVDLEIVDDQPGSVPPGDSAAAGSEDPSTWYESTIHHTTVWLDDDTTDSTGAQPVQTAPPTEVLPAESARAVFRQLQTAHALSRERCRKLLDALRTTREAYRSMSDRVDELQGQLREATEAIAEASADDTGRREDEIERLADLQNQLTAAHAKYDADIQALRSELVEAQQRCADWDERAQQWDAERQAWAAERDQWQAERAAWEFERNDWQTQRNGWDRQTQEWEARLADHVRRIEELERLLADAAAASGRPDASQATGPQADVRPPEFEGQECSSHGAPEPDSAGVGPDDNVATDQPPPEASSAHLDAAGPAQSAQPVASEPSAVVAENHGGISWESSIPSWEEPTSDVSTQSAPTEPKVVEVPAADASDAAAGTEPAEPAESVEPQSVEKPRPVSYIERFSHLFDDECPAESESPTAPQASSQSDVVGKPRNTPIIRRDGSSSSAIDEPEESIEQYMAKLMQRMRGERPAALTSVPSEPEPPVAQAASPAEEKTGPAEHVADAAPEAAADGTAPELTALVRRSPAPDRPTNLEALRALANETARRAIGVHAIRTHRQKAVTKFIVASLAGLTSVWLMMLAPDWRDLQFVTACVALLIAAFWAGQTYGTLLELARAADFDGPGAGSDDLLDDLNPRLPIDG